VIRLGAALGFLGVALGAFGAHGLKDRLGPGMLDVYKTGVLYHLVHALAVLAVGLGADLSAPAHPSSSPRSPRASRGLIARPRAVATLFALGVVVFSGSLYALAFTGVTTLGAITPIGGLLFMAGWVTLAINR
jgi:uncharacterized membrane protein YgdD (TMEM256/DUF423 family)